MKSRQWAGLEELLDALNLSEEPMGMGYANHCPEGALMPKKGTLPTRELEAADGLDWASLRQGFSCSIGHIWRARRKGLPVCFSAERFGCLGAAFWMGFSGPSTEAQIQYVSTGIPGALEGECYLDSPESMRRVTEDVAPQQPPAKYLLVRPLSQFSEPGPEMITFFSRPESLAGLHQLAAFVTGDPDVVRSPWGPGCGGIITWPLYYLRNGETRAVLGGWDPSARMFYKTDELTFTVPLPLFQAMLLRWKESFLARPVWQATRKKAGRSRKVWKD